MAAIGLTMAEFEATYRQVIRVTPTRPLPWRGRGDQPGSAGGTRAAVAAPSWLAGLIGRGARLVGRGAPA
jgi:hypothetical protein